VDQESEKSKENNINYLRVNYDNKSIKNMGQALVAHTCNPTYSGGRDQEDHGSKPAWANSLRDPILKKPHYKRRAGEVA
jgi:hypothetical protein